MTRKLRKLDLENVFRHDAAKIKAARELSRLIHATSDIDASGDEVEQAVREIFQQRLALKYYVGHGHILDDNLTTSPQLDAIITDSSGSPALLKSRSGAEYFPYESVYAFGEVKSTYYKTKKYFHEFTEKIAYVRNRLQRATVPGSYYEYRMTFGTEYTIGAHYPYLNPLFTFMFFVASNNFSIDDIRELYTSRKPTELPNIVCFLDRGVIVNVKSDRADHFTNFNDIIIMPEFNTDKGASPSQWILIPFEKFGASLAYFVIVLSAHLQNCTLMSPDLPTYLNKIFSWNSRKVEKI